MKCYEKALQLDATNGQAIYGKGRCYAIQENFISAIESFNKAIELDDCCAEYYYNKGLAQRQLEEYDNAIEAFRFAIGMYIK